MHTTGPALTHHAAVDHIRMTPRPGLSLSGVGTVFQAVMSLLVLAVVVGVVLMVLRPAGPAWLEQVGQELDGLVRTITGSGS